jgi:hypothetical protein
LAPFLQPLLLTSYISPVLPCPVTSAPENGDSMFLQNVGIDLQIHMAPKHKTSKRTNRKLNLTTKWNKLEEILTNFFLALDEMCPQDLI